MKSVPTNSARSRMVGAETAPRRFLREIVEDLAGASRGEILRQFNHEVDLNPALDEAIRREVFELEYADVIAAKGTSA